MSTNETEEKKTHKKPRKKPQRSQSPRAVERRKLQNRIAQRNHRQKLKEKAAAAASSETQETQDIYETQEDTVETGDTQDLQRLDAVTDIQAPELTSEDFLFDRDPSPLMDTTLVMDDIFAQNPSAWPNFDTNMMLHTPVSETASSAPYCPAPLTSTCTCNGVTGPCARHLEEIRGQMINAMSPKPRETPSMPVAKPRDMPDTVRGSGFAQSLEMREQQQQPHRQTRLQQQQQPCVAMQDSSDQQQQHLRQSRQPFSFQTDATFTIQPRPGMTSRKRSADTSPARSSACTHSTPTRLLSTNTTARNPASLARTSSSSEEDCSNQRIVDTAKFKTILDTVRQAGFADLDSMVLAYYTSQFERRSVAEMSQRASRGRRLPTLIKELYENSNGWTKWESRSLREGLIKTTQTICVQEMEMVTRDPKATPNLDSQRILSRLGITTSDSSTTSSDSNSEPSPSKSEDSSNAPIEDVVFQDEAPSLWSLLTELTGTQSLHCDRVSQAILSLLLHMRQNPEGS